MTGGSGSGGRGPGGDAVLVLRALGLGDALSGVAALRGVRRAWPDRTLVLAAPAGVGSWLRDLGVVDEVLPTSGLEPLAWTGAGHVAVNLHGRGPQSHRLLQRTGPERLVAFASAEAGVRGPAWRADEHEVDRWCRLVTGAGGPCGREDLRLLVEPARDGGGSAPVLVHPGAASGSRRWPVQRWGAVVAGLTRSRAVVLTGGPDERDLCDAVIGAARSAGATDVRSTAGTLDLAALSGAIAGAALVICGDTGVAHVATGVGTPSVLLFGPTPPQWWGPAIDTDRHLVLWHGTEAGDPHGAEVDPALAAIAAEEVLAAAQTLL